MFGRIKGEWGLENYAWPATENQSAAARRAVPGVRTITINGVSK